MLFNFYLILLNEKNQYNFFKKISKFFALYIYLHYIKLNRLNYAHLKKKKKNYLQIYLIKDKILK